MSAVMDWVASIDLTTLYVLLGVAAFVESIFPPAPADVVVAFGGFLAARHHAHLVPTVAAIVGGSVLGAMVIYLIARHFGADWMHRQLRRLKLLDAEEKLEAIYANYGLAALFVSRFLPGLRAVVPPMAGALRVHWAIAAAVIAFASAIWYGLIVWVAFGVGNNWEQVQGHLHLVGRRVLEIAGVAAILLALVGWRLWARHRAKRAAEARQPT
jgi:membrane protein DedA with SNARE-associated domain